jgi:hypothetical protein
MAGPNMWYSGAAPMLFEIGEGAATQTFKDGDVIAIGTGGQIEDATNDAAWHGIARLDATGTQATAIPIEIPIPYHSVYSVYLKTGRTHAVALIGSIVDFETAAGADSWNDNGAATDAMVLNLDPRDAVGTDMGRLLVVFLTAKDKFLLPV